MTDNELVLSMLDEISTKEILEAKQPETMDEHIQVAQQGGSVARNARKELEKQTGKAVASPLNDTYRDWETDRKSTRLNSSHRSLSRMPSSA